MTKIYTKGIRSDRPSDPLMHLAVMITEYAGENGIEGDHLTDLLVELVEKYGSPEAARSAFERGDVILNRVQ